MGTPELYLLTIHPSKRILFSVNLMRMRTGHLRLDSLWKAPGLSCLVGKGGAWHLEVAQSVPEEAALETTQLIRLVTTTPQGSPGLGDGLVYKEEYRLL